MLAGHEEGTEMKTRLKGQRKTGAVSPPRIPRRFPVLPIYWESMAAHLPPYGGGLNFAISKSPVALLPLVSTTLLRCRVAGVCSIAKRGWMITHRMTEEHRVTF